MGLIRRRRLGLWSTFVVCAVIVGAILATVFTIGMNWSRDALTEQVQEAERLLADERAAQAAAALDQAQDRLEALAHQPLFGSTFADPSLDRLRNVLESAARLPAVAGYAAKDAEGRTLVSTPGANRRTPDIVRYRSDVLGPDGPVGTLEIALSVPDLLSTWSTSDRVALLRTDGRHVIGAPTPVDDALRAAIADGRSTVLTHLAGDERRIAAVSPVGRGELVVVASEPQAQANAAARALTARTAALLVVTLLVLVALGIVMVRLVHRMRAGVEAERAAAEDLALTDPLTGLANRRGLERAVLGADAVITVAAIDVDGLKTINDRLGHAAGDTALREVASALRRAVRPGDIVARIGGDEFVLVWMGSTDQDRARLTARLRNALGELVLASASVGVATGHPARFGDVLASADARCYEEKRGRKHLTV